jgi:DNA-binding GntR family transcriptional regulator
MPPRGLQRVAGASALSASLDRSSFVPLYFQLAEVLKERIESGRWEPGARFLSESQIEAEFAVSRTVIRPALALLESDGQLVRTKGRGNFVAAPKQGVRVRGLGRLLAGLGESELAIDILEARSVLPENAVSEMLELGPGAVRVAHLTARISRDESPVMICNSFVSLERLPWILDTAKADRGGHRTRRALDVSFGRAEVSVETAFVSLWEAQELQLSPGDPCFLMSYLDRVRSDAGPEHGWPAEFARLVFRTDVRLDLAANLGS